MTDRKRIAIIIPRFFPDIACGSEKLALDYALILKNDFHVEIFTTCARDYLTWKNELPEGKEIWNDITVNRFAVERNRNIQSMNHSLNELLNNLDSIQEKEEDKFIIEQGPYSPKLVSNFLKEQSRFDLAIFIGYLYYPIVKLLPNVKIRKLIIPTFHDEPALSLPIYQRTFLTTYTYSFNAPEELTVFENRFGATPNHVLIGTYVKEQIVTDLKQDQKVRILTLGRMEAAKGFIELFQYFDQWMGTYEAPELEMVCIGSNHLDSKDVPKSIQMKGFVSEKEKESLLRRATILINPSPFESFSIAMMEAWSFGIPVLVNGKSDVMRGHNLRSQGGLHYSDEISFRRCLEYLIERPQLRRRLGENGRKYVLANFTYNVVARKLISTVNKLLG